MVVLLQSCMIEGPAHKHKTSATKEEEKPLNKASQIAPIASEKKSEKAISSTRKELQNETDKSSDRIPAEVKKSIAKALNVEEKQTDKTSKKPSKTQKKVQSKPAQQKPKETPKKKEIPDIKQVVRKPMMSFEKTSHNFGRIVAGETFETSFTFVNTGNAPLEIMNASASCGCTTPVFPFLPIDPGQKGTIGVHYDSKGKLGQQKAEIKLITNISKDPVYVYLDGVVLDKAPEDIKSEEASAKDTID